MNVFDGDLEELEWEIGNTRLKIISDNGDVVFEVPRIKHAPWKKHFNNIMNQAKLKSNEGKNKSVFIILENMKQKKEIPFVEYNEGKLVAFCRPPWRPK
jgi:hypothetical protein